MRTGVLAAGVCAALLFVGDARAAGTPTWFGAPPFPNATDSFVPRVAESGTGDVVFSWVSKDGTGSHAMAIASLPAGPGTPTVSSDSRGGALSDANVYPPAIAVSATGDALVAWKEGPRSLGLRLRQAPGDFGSSNVKATPGANAHDTIESAITAGADANGNFTIAYGDELPIPYSGSNNLDRILVWNLDASSGLMTGPVFVGQTDTPATTYPITDVTLAEAADGSAVLAYRQYVAGMNELDVSTRSGPTGSWSSPYVLDFSGDQPRVAAGTGGRALVAWRHIPETLGATFEVRAAFAPSTGSGFTTVGPFATGTLSDASLASGEANVALDASGRGLVVWQTCTGCGTATAFREVKAQPVAPDGQLDETVQTVSGQSPDPTFMNPQVAVTPAGGAVVVWQRTVNGHSILEYTRRAGPHDPFAPAGAVPADSEVATPVVDGGPELAVDNFGDATVGWEQSTGAGSAIPHLARLDATPPSPGSITLTGAPAPLVPLTFTISPRDTVSPTTVRWMFGDGSTASGTTVRHLYTGPGKRTVTATVTDGAGYVASTTRTLTLPGVSVPRFLGAVTLRPARLRLSRRVPQVELRWRLTAAATVHITVTRSRTGHRSRGRCSTRIRRGPRCTVTVTLSRQTIAGRSGMTRTRVTLPRLRAGRYTLTVQATNDGGRSRAVRFSLTITR